VSVHLEAARQAGCLVAGPRNDWWATITRTTEPFTSAEQITWRRTGPGRLWIVEFWDRGPRSKFTKGRELIDAIARPGEPVFFWRNGAQRYGMVRAPMIPYAARNRHTRERHG
jgi:hypothetical protein